MCQAKEGLVDAVFHELQL